MLNSAVRGAFQPQLQRVRLCRAFSSWPTDVLPATRLNAAFDSAPGNLKLFLQCTVKVLSC